MNTKAIAKMFCGNKAQSLLVALLLFISNFAYALTVPVAPAPDATCVVSALNRNATMEGAYYLIPGVPSQLGSYRVRAICSDGTVGQTSLVKPAGGAPFTAGPIVWGYVTPIPQSLIMDPPANVNYGQTVQLTTRAVALDGSVSDVTLQSQGTNYGVSNPALASISSDGLLTVLDPRLTYATQLVVSATNQGTPVSRLIKIGPHATITGKVTLSNGLTAVAGAQVSIQLNAPLTRYPVQTTNAAGTFSLANAPVGDYSITVIDPVTGNRGSKVTTLAANGQGVFDVKLAGQGSINVTVVGNANQPVSGAQLVLSHAQFAGVLSSTQTNVSGFAAVTGFVAGNFNLTVRDPATGGIATASGSLADGGVANITVTLQSAGIISGRVLSADGLAQAGYQVRLLSASKGMVSSAMTGVDGKFRFDSLLLADSPYTLLAVASGSIQGSSGNLVLAYAGQELQQDILLGSFASGGVVSGKVVDQSNTPQSNLTVTLIAATGQSLISHTDTQGVYQVSGVPLGNFTVTAATAGYSGTANGTVHANGEQIITDITVLPYGQVKGAVLLSSGQPAANINIVFHSGIYSALQLLTDNGGNFAIDNVPLGTYAIEASDPVTGERGLINDLLSAPNEMRVHQLTLTATSKLRVQVISSGVPLANARVNLALQGSIPYGAELVTDTNGVVEFASVPRSAYSLAVISTDNGGMYGRAVGALSQANESVTVGVSAGYLPIYSVFGQVLDTKAMPVANQWVRLSSRDMPTGGTVPIPNNYWDEYLVKTDASGNFNFQNITVHDDGRGRFKVDALVNGQLAGRVVMSTPTSGQVVNQDVALFTAGKVAGLVSTGASKPLVGASILLIHQDDHQFSANDFATKTDYQGHYVLPLVPMGGFTVAVSDGAGSQLASSPASLQQEGQSVTLNFNLGNLNLVALKGTVFSYGGGVLAPSSRVTLSLLNQGGQLVRNLIVDPQSNFSALLSLNSGVQYQINGVATHPQGMPLTGSSVFTVQAGQDAVVSNITFQETGTVTGLLKSRSGVALSGSTFQLFNSNGSIYRSATTNQTGTYNFSEVAVGSYTLRAQYGKFTFEKVLSVSAGQVSVQDVVVPQGSVQGTLTNSNGIALQSHLVSLSDADGTNQRYDYTDAAGHFKFLDVLAGVSVLSITEGAYNATQSVTVADNSIATPNLIVPMGRIIGKLTYQGGVPAQRITLSVRTKSGVNYRLITTGLQGDFILSDIPAGLYDISDDQGRVVALNVAVTSSADMQVTWSLSSTPPLLVRVKRSNGTPLTGVTVYGHYNSNYKIDLGVTNSDGLIVVNANYCPYFVKYSAPYPGNANITVATTTPPPPCNQSQAVDLQFKSIADLKITSTQNGTAPMAGVKIFGINWLGQSSVYLGDSDTNGQLNIASLAEGSYSLLAKTTNGLSQQLSVAVDAASDGASITKTVDFATQFEKFGKLGFADERHLYSVSVKQGDKLAITVHGAQVDSTVGADIVSTDIYSPDKSNKASGYGYGTAFNYYQDSMFGDLQNVMVDVDGNYVIAIKPYNAWYLGGYYLNALVNGQPAEIKPYQNGGSVQGTVYLIDGIKPLPNATVDISTQDVLGLHMRTTTNADGHYRFDNVPLTDLTVALIESGQVEVSATGKLDTPAQVITKDLKVPQKTTLQVSVTVADVIAIPYAMNFSVKDASGTHNLGPVYFMGNRTSNTLSTMAFGDSITVGAIYPGNANITATKTVSGADGQTVVVNLLLGSEKISGTVLQADGTPAAGIWVATHRASDYGYITSTYSDNLGQYALTELPVGQDLLIAAQNPGNQIDSTISVNLSNGQQLVGQDISLIATGSVDGYVKLASGAPVPDASVVVNGVINGRNFSISSVSDQNGHYQLDYVPIGNTIQVLATSSGPFVSTLSQGAFVVSPGQLLTLPDFIFNSGASLKVNVLDGNHQATPLVLLAEYAECGPNRILLSTSNGFSWINPNGDAFDPILDIPEGQAVVSLHDGCNGRDPLATASINIVANQPHKLDLLVPIVRGRVTLNGGQPVAYPSVTLTQDSLDGGITTNYGTETNRFYGEYVMVGVAPGDFTINASAYYNGTGLNATEIATKVGFGNMNMDVVLPYEYVGPSKILGSVRAINGMPVPFADVTLVQEGETFYATADDSGHYEFVDWLVARPFDITVQDPVTSLSATASGTVVDGVISIVDLVMPYSGPAKIVGTVSNSDGMPAVGLKVSLTQNGSITHATTDITGYYYFESPSVGAFDVTSLDAVSGLSATSNGTVVDGAINTVDLVMPYFGPAKIVGTVKSSDGTPAAGLDVALAQNGSTVHAATDATGYYHFDTPTVGAFDITALNVTTGLSVSLTGIVVDRAISTVNLVMPFVPAKIVGTVKLKDGTPAVGLDVALTQIGSTVHAATDAAGYYHFDSPSTGAFDIAVQDSVTLLWSTASGVVVNGVISTVDLVMPSPPAKVVGIIKSGDGTPAVGLDVSLTQNGSTVHTTTDVAGYYHFDTPSLGAFDITALDSVTGLSASSSGTVIDGAISSVNLVMPAVLVPAQIVGTVSNSDGTPAVGLDVSLIQNGSTAHSTTDAIGYYHFDTPSVGTFDLVVLDPVTGLSATSSGVVVDGAVSSVNLVMPAVLAPAKIIGTVSNSDGTPSVGLDVALTQNGSTVHTTTDAAGYYHFDTPNVGVFDLVVLDPVTGLSATSNGIAAEGVIRSVNLVMPAVLASAKIAGTVSNSNDMPAVGLDVALTQNGSTVHATTDAAGYYHFDTPSVGAFDITALNITTGQVAISSGVAADGTISTVNLFMPSFGPAKIVGTVSNSDGTPAVGMYVVIIQNGSTVHTMTDAMGYYHFDTSSGAFGITALNVTTGQMAISSGMAADSTISTVNLVMPYIWLAKIEGRVWKYDGTPASGIDMALTQNGATVHIMTDATGYYHFDAVSLGAFDITALDPATGSSTSTNGMVGSGVTSMGIDLAMPYSGSAKIVGTVSNSDGTPAVGSDVALTQNGVTVHTTTDVAGYYHFDTPSAGAFDITALDPVTGLSVSSSGTVIDGVINTVDVRLPVAKIAGTVSNSDGTPAVGLDVNLYQNGLTLYATTDTIGYYHFDLPSVGAFDITAQDSVTGLLATTSGTSVYGVISMIDMSLPVNGSVTGTVLDAAGNAASGATIALDSSGVAFTRWVTADSLGQYRFDHVALGDITAFAQDVNGYTSMASGNLGAADSTTVIDIVFSGTTASITGTVFESDGMTPVANANVTVKSLMPSGPFVPYSSAVMSDNFGVYVANNIPTGNVSILASAPANYQIVGLVSGAVSAAATNTIDVTLGNATRFNFNLDGSDGYRYDVMSDGALFDGGTVSGIENDAYNGAYYLGVNGQYSSGEDAALLENGSRQLVFGPKFYAGLDVTRKVFVPVTGGYVRYLELLHNPSSADAPIPIDIVSSLGSDTNTRIVVSPLATGMHYAITDQRGYCCDPTLGHVFASTGARVAVSNTQFIDGNNLIQYRWDVTVPAGGTVALMHFGIQRGGTDSVGVQVQAEALVNETDPYMFDGMSPAEKAEVLNFAIP